MRDVTLDRSKRITSIRIVAPLVGSLIELRLANEQNVLVLEQKILKTIQRYNMLCPGDRVLVAVSGGVDSVVLLRSLHLLAADHRWTLGVAHLDHQMRLDSHHDMAFVRRLAEELGLAFFGEATNVPMMIQEKKLSPEDAARVARYDFLKRAASEFGACRIAFGHNLNDRAETFLLNLIRGSGLQGLAGMPPLRQERGLFYVRPLIECTREEIEQTAAAHCWTYRDDPTNKAMKYTRNRIRSRLLPEILDNNPQGLEAIARSSEILQRVSHFLEPLVCQQLDALVIPVPTGRREISLDRKGLARLDEFLLEAVLREAIRRVKGDLNGIEAVHLERAVREIHKASSGSWVPLVGELRCVLESASVRITAEPEPRHSARSHPYELMLKIGQKNDLAQIGWSFELELHPGKPWPTSGRLEAVFDFDKIKEPLVVRNRRPGDHFRPLGLDGEKKIQDLFVDAKIPRERRDGCPIICDAEGIVWVVGLRASERTKVLLQTATTLRIRAISLGQEWEQF